MLATCAVAIRCSIGSLNDILIRRFSFAQHHFQYALVGTRSTTAATRLGRATARLRSDRVGGEFNATRSTRGFDHPDITTRQLPDQSRALSPRVVKVAEVASRGSEIPGSIDSISLIASLANTKSEGKPTRHISCSVGELQNTGCCPKSTTTAQESRHNGGPYIPPSQSAHDKNKWENLENEAANVEEIWTTKQSVTEHVTLDEFRTDVNEGLDSMKATREREYSLRGGKQTISDADSLFEHLRNPKGTKTDSRQKPAKKSSMGGAGPEQKTKEANRSRGFHKAIEAASTDDIEQKLYRTAHESPHLNGVQFMVRELLEVRHIQPQARHYEALILSNCASDGSVSALWPLLAEMEREAIGVGASTLSAVLKVLAIHPDANLLATILQEQAAQWVTPDIPDQVHTILSLIRLNQFELALPRLETLISSSPSPDYRLHTPVPQFFYTTLLYRLSSPAISDHTATLHLLYLLQDNNLPVSSVCVSYMLDSAAEALHVELVLYLWRSHVDTEYVVPSSALCRNVLLTAARAGNAELAIKAGRWLESRGLEALHHADGFEGTRHWASEGGLQVEEIEMIREAFLGDMKKRDEEGETDTVQGQGKNIDRGRERDDKRWKVDLHAVHRLDKRMLELRNAEARVVEDQVARADG